MAKASTASFTGEENVMQETDQKSVFVSAAHFIEKGIRVLCRAIMLSTGLFLLFILTAIVLLRYSNAGSIDSGAELSALVFPVFVMAGIVEAALTGAHVATQVMLNVLNAVWRKRLTLLIHAVTAALYLYLSSYAYQNAVIAHEELSTILQVPGSVGYGSLAIGLALVGVCSLCAIVRYTFGKEKVTINLAESGPGVV